jgi:predicted RND superfamily exporter protein
MWIRIASFILRNRLPILIVLALLTAFMGYHSRRIEMSYEYAPLLPEDDSVYQEYERFADRFGNEGNIMALGVQDSLFFNVDHFRRWQMLSEELEKISGVTSVISVSDSYQLIRNNQSKKFDVKPVFSEVANQKQLDSLARVFENLPFYEGLLYNKNTHTYLLGVVLDMDVLESSGRVKLMQKIENFGQSYEEDSGNIVRYSGLPYIRVETAEMIKRELNMFIWLALFTTALIIFLFFRSFKVVFFSMLVVGAAVIWALGLQAIIGYKITILTGLIPPLIIVIGIPNSVFLLNKYHHEFRSHGNKIRSLQRVIRKIGNATFLTNLTTASGFAAFIFTSSRLLVEFGVMAAINIMVVFILSLLLIPIIFSFLSDPQKRHVQHLDRPVIEKILNRLVRVSLKHKKIVFAGTLGLLVFGGVGIARMETTGYMLDDIPHKHQLYQDLGFFEKHFNGLMPLEILIDTRKPGGVMQQKTLQKIDLLQEKLKTIPELSKGLSILGAVKFARQAYYNGSSSYYGIPNSMERNFILSYLPRNGEGDERMLASSFIDSSRQVCRISFRMKDVGTKRMVGLDEEMRAIVDSVFPASDYDTSVTGSSIVFFKGTDYLVRNLFVSLALAVLLIALFMAWMFRSFRMVVVSLLPNLIPLITTAALMGFFGIPIKPSTILVFSIAFGISVDDTIHFLAKYRQELTQTNWSIRAATVLA